MTTPLTPAALWRRAVAFLLDVLLLQIPILLWVAMAPAAPSVAGWSRAAVGLGLVLFYFVLFEAVWGATVGKRLLRVRVVSAGGTSIGWGTSIVRNVLRVVDALPIAYLLGAAVALASPLRQRVGDRAARSVVVRV